MRTVGQCWSILDNAKRDGTIRDFHAFSNPRIAYGCRAHITIYFTDWREKTFSGKKFTTTYYAAADYVLSLYPKEEEVVRLSEAVSQLFTCWMTGWPILLWGKNHVAVDCVSDQIRAYFGGCNAPPIICTCSDPTLADLSRASIVIKIGGGPTALNLTIEKHRHASSGHTIKCNADCYFEETTVGSNVTPKPCPYKHLHPDSAGYAECFRILRDGKKDGMITTYGFYNPDNGPIAWINDPYKGEGRFLDTDGTKGDIGVLREAADYALELRAKRLPDPSTMAEADMVNEINEHHFYATAGYIFGNANIPTLTLMDHMFKTTNITLGAHETRHQFLVRCVEYIRANQDKQ